MKQSKLSSLLICGAMIASLAGGPVISQAAENADTTPKTEAAEKPAAKPEEDKPAAEIKSVTHTLRWDLRNEDGHYIESWHHVEKDATPERLQELYEHYQAQIDEYMTKHGLVAIETRQETNENVSGGNKTIEQDNVIISKPGASTEDENEGQPEKEVTEGEDPNAEKPSVIDQLDDFADEHGDNQTDTNKEGENASDKKEEAKPAENKVVATNEGGKGSSGQQYAQTGTLGGGLIAAMGASISGAGAFTFFRRKK